MCQFLCQYLLKQIQTKFKYYLIFVPYNEIELCHQIVEYWLSLACCLEDLQGAHLAGI